MASGLWYKDKCKSINVLSIMDILGKIYYMRTQIYLLVFHMRFSHFPLASGCQTGLHRTKQTPDIFLCGAALIH